MANTRQAGLGEVVGGTYRLDALLGKGGMGAVYRASHVRLPNKYAAIKFLHADVVNPEVLARFRREAEIASRLGHPHIVRVDDINELADGTPYLVLEYLQGEALADLIARGPVPLPAALEILRQVGSALTAAHREGIVHRDLKPHNIFMVQTEAGAICCKVLDFGISKIRGSTTVRTQEAAVLGTPQYMSPEQANGQQDLVDERTDVFALATIAYEMLVGRPAFDGMSIPEVMFKVVYQEPPPLGQVAPHLAGHIENAINAALAKDAAQRIPTVEAFLAALRGEGVASVAAAVSAAPIPPIDAMAMTMASDSQWPRAEVASLSPTGALASSLRHAGASLSHPPGARSQGGKSKWFAAAALAVGGGAVAIYVAATHRAPAPPIPAPSASATVSPANVPRDALTPTPTPMPMPTPTLASAPASIAAPAVASAVASAPAPPTTPTGSKGSATPAARPAVKPASEPAEAATNSVDADNDGPLALLRTQGMEAAKVAAKQVLVRGGDESGAHAVLAMDACQREDIEAFRSHLRQVKRPRQRAAAVKFCKSHGMTP